MARGWPGRALSHPTLRGEVSDGPIRDDDPKADLTHGHPTRPGDLDQWKPRRGGDSPGNGQPGTPRYKSLGPRHGPGIPGPTPSGPSTPGVVYDDGSGGR